MAQEELGLSPLLTHQFRLREYKQAFRTLAARGQSGALKAVSAFD
jgi:threonine dehydrogenase-like Zn-dependent dehydrogenase